MENLFSSIKETIHTEGTRHRELDNWAIESLGNGYCFSGQVVKEADGEPPPCLRFTTTSEAVYRIGKTITTISGSTYKLLNPAVGQYEFGYLVIPESLHE